MKRDVLREISLNGIVPVVVLEKEADALPLAKALLAAGVRVMEVTFRTDAARGAIAAIAGSCPDMLVGAGTVTSVELAREAVAAGAAFVVSPGYDPEVVGWCMEREVPVFPGISTATEAQAAVKQGLKVLKFYPAEILGGPKAVKALADVFPGVKFMPTGGIEDGNLRGYLDLPCVLACGGSWICPRDLIAQGRFQEIEEIARRAVLNMHGFYLLHIGVNSKDEAEARQTAQDFAGLLGLPVIDLPAAFFAGTLMEIVKTPFLGTHGHIAISANYMDRAMAYFESRGYRFRPDPGSDEKGIIAAYFDDLEIGGFAVHLRRRLDA